VGLTGVVLGGCPQLDLVFLAGSSTGNGNTSYPGCPLVSNFQPIGTGLIGITYYCLTRRLK